MYPRNSDFYVHVTPEALVITSVNENGTLINLSLDSDSRFIFDREDLPGALIANVVMVGGQSDVCLKDMETDGGYQGLLSPFETMFILNGRKALMRLRPEKGDGYGFQN